MSNYDVLGQYYDSFMKFEPFFNDFIGKVLSIYKIEVDSVLEIACGTGRNLLYFNQSKQVYGLDLSPVMIQRAKENIPNGHFILQDMVNFKIGQDFQLILCMFDSINHLKDYSQWISTFKSVYAHLKDKGYFIFDINTTYALNLPVSKRTMFRQHQDDYLVMQYYNSGTDQATWDMNFFIHQDGDNYKHYFESITEKSFEIQQIRSSLLELFSNVEVLNEKLEFPSTEDSRVFFICKK